MDANKKHITEITRQDLEDLAAATHIVAGEGILVSKANGCIVISIDPVGHYELSRRFSEEMQSEDQGD